MATVISDEQKEYLISIVDSYLNLHKNVNKHLCIQPDKREDINGNIICYGDCEECTDELYTNRRKAILKQAGLSEETK